ncbi:uncharacterized protein LOC121242100 isoform X3 [Juglans microcarpa x Juglans regia]|uniref:uncharacterized protein LOC121242100 isoform X3 n=1 Tax=Juglans microcarpa x Juglans regia TaxID=2249226 RepID=UPI001B7F06BF|nr:uncharacterized protein LOC121242100 isoform X3 [Juglans microcarpa x Juglans regia]
MASTKTTLGRLTIICLIILVIHEGVDELAAWIVGERAELENEVKKRWKFGYYAKKEMTRLKNEKIEMECCLDQVDGHIRHLEFDLEFLRDEVCEVCDELLRAQNIQSQEAVKRRSQLKHWSLWRRSVQGLPLNF